MTRRSRASFDRELTELGEDVTYLKVKLRREGAVPRADYTDLSNRVSALERRVRGDDGRRHEPVESTRHGAPARSRSGRRSTCGCNRR